MNGQLFFYHPSLSGTKPKWKIKKPIMLEMNDYFECISKVELFEDRDILLGNVSSKEFAKKWMQQCPWFADEDYVYKVKITMTQLPVPFMFAHEFAEEWYLYTADKKLFNSRKSS